MNRCSRPEPSRAADFRLDVALVHHPVVNRTGEIIGSAVTNLDLHDIARAGRTFGIRNYWVVTPYPLQQELAESIVRHWTDGYGGRVNTDRAEALSLIKICPCLEDVLDAMTQLDGCLPKIVATSATQQEKRIQYHELRQELLEQERSVLLLLGTAWGLAPEVMDRADAVLPPIQGPGAFNHLSVRSAASIMLDRLLGRQE
jgi:hypothetical protein